jgi:hypothetical protein
LKQHVDPRLHHESVLLELFDADVAVSPMQSHQPVAERWHQHLDDRDQIAEQRKNPDSPGFSGKISTY